MAKKYLAHIDLNQNELRNAVIQPLASDPSTPSDGQLYYNTTSDVLKYYVTGTGWMTVGTGAGAGDVSSNTASSVDNEIALFSGTSGKTLKRATQTGIIKATSGVIGTATEGTDYYGPGGTDVAVADGGTGRSTGTTAYSLVATGTTATGAQQTLANGATTELLVGGGASALPVWTTATGSGAPVRATSPTLVTPVLGTPTSVTLTNATGLPVAGITASTSTALGVGSVELGHATDTTLSRSAAGVLAVEGVVVPTISSTNTFTNKTIDANGTGNSITNLEVADFTAASIVTAAEGVGSNNNDTTLPTTAAVKAYADAAVGAADAMVFKGSTDASTNPNYPAGVVGDTYKISVAGKIGGASGIVVEVGDTYIATADNAGGTQAAVGASWTVLQTNTVAATDTVAGTVELATVGETETRTDTTRAVTPAGLATFPRKYSATIGDGAATSIAVTHSLGTKDVVSQVRQVSDDAVVECDIVNTSTTQTTFSFAVAPAASAIRVVIVG